jgi:hypothetical protein
MVAAFFGCSCFLACFGAGIITRPFSASRVTGNELRQKSDPPGLPRGRLIEGEAAPCRGSASGSGEPRPKNRKMTGYPPMTQPSRSFEVETDCAAREERRILEGRECGMRYHPALHPCFARHFGPGPRM